MYAKSRREGASSRIAKRHKIKKYASAGLKAFVGVFFLMSVVFISRANFLKIKDFEVVGASIVPVQSVKNTAATFVVGNEFLFVPKTNILALDQDELEKTLINQFNRIEKVKVDKKIFSRVVEVKVEEREGEYLWCSETEECFFMSKDGFIFEKVSEDKAFEAAGKIVFRGMVSGSPLLQNFASADKMHKFDQFITDLGASDIPASSVNIELPDKGVLETKIGKIIFNPEDTDLKSIVQNIILLVSDIKSKKPAAQFDYIDARFGNKVFYKTL